MGYYDWLIFSSLLRSNVSEISIFFSTRLCSVWKISKHFTQRWILHALHRTTFFLSSSWAAQWWMAHLALLWDSCFKLGQWPRFNISRLCCDPFNGSGAASVITTEGCFCLSTTSNCRLVWRKLSSSDRFLFLELLVVVTTETEPLLSLSVQYVFGSIHARAIDFLNS